MWKGSEKRLDKHVGRYGQCGVWDAMWQAWKFLFYSACGGEPLKLEQGSEMIKACLQPVKKSKPSSGFTMERAICLKLQEIFVCRLEKDRPVHIRIQPRAKGSLEN